MPKVSNVIDVFERSATRKRSEIFGALFREQKYEKWICPNENKWQNNAKKDFIISQSKFENFFSNFGFSINNSLQNRLLW